MFIYITRIKVKCKTCSNEFELRPRQLLDKKHKIFCSRKCFGASEYVPKIERVCEFCESKFLAYPSAIKFSGAKFCSRVCADTFNRGWNHFRFKGASTEAEKLRKSPAYRNWRTSIFIRDGKKCVFCNSKTDIEADHIKPRYLFPELTLDLDNGRTLCHNCHVKTPSYMNGYMKREDFITSSGLSG